MHVRTAAYVRGVIGFEPTDLWPDVELGTDLDLAERVDRAAAEADPDPSEEAKKAGNYRKGHVTIQGLPIAIENARGSTRSGRAPNGRPWSVVMGHHYGYIKRTESEADGDHVDVFIGPDPDSELVFVIDQHKPDGSWDEHKCMLGFKNESDAKKGYRCCYAPGWKGLGGVCTMTMARFKDWLDHGDTSQPACDREFGTTWELATYHAPPGYTHKTPLLIAGKPFVSGEFVPNSYYRQATPAEREKLVKVGGKTPRPPAPSLLVEGKHVFTQKPDGSWETAKGIVFSNERMHDYKAQGKVADAPGKEPEKPPEPPKQEASPAAEKPPEPAIDPDALEKQDNAAIFNAAKKLGVHVTYRANGAVDRAPTLKAIRTKLDAGKPTAAPEAKTAGVHVKEEPHPMGALDDRYEGKSVWRLHDENGPIKRAFESKEEAEAEAAERNKKGPLPVHEMKPFTPPTHAEAAEAIERAREQKHAEAGHRHMPAFGPEPGIDQSGPGKITSDLDDMHEALGKKAVTEVPVKEEGPTAVRSAVKIASQLDPEAIGSLLGAFQKAHKAGYTGREAQTAAFSMYQAQREGAAPETLRKVGDFIKATAEIEEIVRTQWSKEPASATNNEGAEPKPPTPHFTGKAPPDALGRVYWWKDGVRVPGPEEAEAAKPDKQPEASEGEASDGLEKQGAEGTGGGLRPREPVGANAPAAPAPELPAAGGGVPERPLLRQLPDRADQRGAEQGGPVGEAGNVPGGGAGTGAGRTAPETGAGAGGVGSGGGAAGHHGGGVEASTESLAQPPTPDNPTDVSAGNFHYTDRDFATGGLKTKFRNNIEAIRVLRNIAAEGRDAATPEEQEILSRYVGWGQFPALFNQHTSAGWEWRKERELLRDLISEEEWQAASGSILNAHYTDPSVVDAHWKMAKRMGFKGGRFLETSAGVGYYLGMTPPDLKAKTLTSAVELDRLTGRIAQLLYPKDNVRIEGFEKHAAPDNFYDLVASNVPFGNYKVFDPRYNKHQANIHDYFFLKSADLTRPGGLVMHITSTGTLDKPDPAIREELAKTCDFVGAIRFPGGTHQAGAGTEVVTDMVILRKRAPGEAQVDPNVTPPEAMPDKLKLPYVESHVLFTGITTDSLGRLYHWKDGKRVPGPKWTETTTVPDPAGGDPIPVNRYFAEHPEMILGTLDRSGTMYRGESVNVSRTDDYEDRLAAAMNALPEGVMKPAAVDLKAFTPEALPAPGDVKDGGYKVQDGKLYQRQGGALVPLEKQPGAKDLARIEGQLKVRDAARALINDQKEGLDASASRAALNAAYDAYVAEHGPLNLPANKRAFEADTDSPLVRALEKYDPKAKTAAKADMFFRDTIRSVAAVEHAKDAAEALGVSLHETGGVDLKRMAALTGFAQDRIEKELVAQGLAYHDPQEGWKSAEVYLSGNVRRKLTLARAAAAADPAFAPNVAALEKVQPEDVDRDDITACMGAPWIPPSDMAAFAEELTGIPAKYFAVGRNAVTGAWDFSYTGGVARVHAMISAGGAMNLWEVMRGEHRVKDFRDVFEAALNGTPLTVYYPKDSEGKTAVDSDSTEAANAKVQEMRTKFKEEWLWSDEERAKRLHRFYNDNYNNIRDVHFNGQFLKLPGMDPGFTPHPHIKDFVWQVVTTGKGLAAHEVGTGKTTAMVASSMELRRMGLAKKPCIACLKANVGAIADEARRLYPGAKILSLADVKDAAGRKRMLAQAATGDYDLVIMTHDNLNALPMTPETEAKYIQDELDDLTTALVGAAEDNPDKGNRIVKELEKAKKNLEEKLQEAINNPRKDNVLYFEDLGIDHLNVDESHLFKTLPVYSQLRGVKGIPTGRSQRATNMLMRTQWIQDHNGGRGVVFATGTPVSNTMAEMYTNQRFLQAKELKERGLAPFDAWRAAFGEMETKMEKKVTGVYGNVTRFSNFVNIPELMHMSRQVMDVQRADDLKKPDGTPQIVRPHRRDGMVLSPKNKAMDDLMASLVARGEALKEKKGPPQKGDDNMLVICTDGRKGAIDMRLLDENAPDDPMSKANQCVRKVLDTHKARPEVTQMIFSDIGVHPVKQKGGLVQHVEGVQPGQAFTGPNGITGVLRQAEQGKWRLEVYDAAGSRPDRWESFLTKTDVENFLEKGWKTEDGKPFDRKAKSAKLQEGQLVGEGEPDEEGEEAAAAAREELGSSNTKFHLYGDIIDKLVKGGIPREAIADFSTLDGMAKENAQQAMREGKIVVAIGGTQKMGTGVNVQNRLAVLHHLDVPWVPAAIEQRDGRAWRQGNQNKEVEINRYIAEGSLDELMWQTVARKAAFIKQVMDGNSTARTAKDEDTEALSFETLKAVASGDPRVLEKVNLDEDVRVLSAAAKRHEREQRTLKDRTIPQLERTMKSLEGVAPQWKDVQQHFEKYPDFSMKIDGQTYTERKDATEAFNAKMAEIAAKRAKHDERSTYGARLHDEEFGERPVGEYRGATIFYDGRNTTLQMPDRTVVRTGDSLLGVEYVARSAPKKIADAEADVTKAKADLARVRGQLGKPFHKAAELKTKQEKAAELMAQLAKQAEPETEREMATDPDDDDLAAGLDLWRETMPDGLKDLLERP